MEEIDALSSMINIEKNLKIMKHRIFKIILIVVCLTGLFLFVHYAMNLGSFRGTSYEECRKRTPGRLIFFKLPDVVEDYRFICHNYGFGADYAEAFTLHDSEYDGFVEEVKKKKSGLVVGYHEELDYTGLRVSETTGYHDDNGNFIGFPASRIEYVIDDDINNYTILYYDAYEGAGASKNAIVSNTVTGRIVIYSYRSN